ncbi:MAG: D-alanyl-D-alanine carboxypeptidase/D-alanyl-D-alanine-endopeptidase [Prevotella sp.]|jgi:D-alanyl-D-alanine carboxypeptidase/D-alanyl-D-alanine-endopeptidase (penicillin-binding protein 4)|nr:D-alanyl-D-alanine carboxypeptidase/D-alanyl-D-alanine-endopeptidase [Prevotella sp.]
MKEYISKSRLLTLLALLLFSVPLAAQSDDENNDDDDDGIADSTLIESLTPDSLTLPWPQGLQHNLNKLLESDMFKTSQVGIMIYDLDADSCLFAHNERQLMRPASTMKMITAVTALDCLGGDYQFKTELCYTGKIENNTLEGGIYLVGGFDPRFNSDDLSAFIEGLRKMNVDTIRGRIYGDKSMKDDKSYGEGWCWDDDNPILSPLLISRKNNLVDRFYRALRDKGVVVEATLMEGRKAPDAFCIVDRFHTIDQILMRMMKESDNLYAEAMYYQIAASTGNRPATAKNARTVEKRLVQKLGLDPSRYRFADGSGLSLYNYVSAELEVRMLRYAYENDNIYNHLIQAMPVAGVDGTLKKRMRGAFTKGNVKAKTGTVTGVSSLAGYCTAANGHHLAFSIINNGIMHTRNGRAFQDKVCTVMCQP